MRLKFLFFPIILVVSIAIFLGYIWPEIDNVMKANEDKLTKNVELQSIKDKQLAIESIGKKISDNTDGEKVVNDYLPENKVEERIISGINYLAGDANVSLVNIALTSAKNVPVATSASTVDPITGQLVVNNGAANLLQTTSAKVSVTGEYDKIRIFLDSLQRMPIINTVKTLSITKQEIKAADAVEGAAVSSVLAADIEVNFGYLAVAKVDNKQVEKFDASLDNETVDSLKKYISQKSQLIGNDSDPKSKKNPFLAN